MILARIALAAAMMAPAAAIARPMTAEDVARLEQVAAIAMAPDGTSIAYTRQHPSDVTRGQDNGPAARQLFVASGPDDARAFLPASMNVSGIRFAPDGALLAFLWHEEDEDAAVWAIPVDGGAETRLAGVEGADVLDYAWSPDGRRLYLLAGAARDHRREDERHAGYDAIVFEEEPRLNRLFEIELDAPPETPPREIAVPGHVSALRLSPDNRLAAIRSAPGPAVDESYTSRRIHLLDLLTGEVERVIETSGKIGDFEISPDGRTLSLLAATDENDPAATTLYFVDLATGTMTALNEGAAEAPVDGEWLADGRLALAVDVGAGSVLRFYTPRGEIEREVDPGSLIVERVVSGGNLVAVDAHSPAHPGELFLWDGQSGFVRWTDHNPWLAEVDFGPQRTITYSARDGQEIEGILIEPVGTPGLAGSPTIMVAHGGPETHYSNGWLTSYALPGQLAAGRGYAVFHPNYRGSTGYGSAFSRQHQGRYTDPEFNDIVDGKNALVEMLVADPDRVGIIGASYGGYAAAWSATALSEEYAAAVALAGVANQISKVGTTDIPNEMYLVHARQWPWEDWQHMLEASPIYHAGEADTPLLIAHGLGDTRLDVSQSYELYRNIKLRTDTPVRLVLYPGEGHGLARAAARYDFNLRMMRWFDTYLKTGNRDAPMPAPRPALSATALD